MIANFVLQKGVTSVIICVQGFMLVRKRSLDRGTFISLERKQTLMVYHL